MLERLQRELPKLTDAVVRAEIYGDPSYDLGTIGAVDAVRETAEAVKETATEAGGEARTAARQARKVPGVARAEGEIKGAVASEEDLRDLGLRRPHGRGDRREAARAVADRHRQGRRLRAPHESRKTILDRVDALRGDEPWPGYDELNVTEIQKVAARRPTLSSSRRSARTSARTSTARAS